MCRALLYLGEPVLLDDFLYRPDSALVRQSTMPRMLHLLNLAGFGMRAWDASSRDPERPFSYASDSLPVFDRNLKGLAEKIAASCVLAHVRGVPFSTRAEISVQNVHPFQFAGVPLALAHNGDLARFAEMKPLLAAHVKPELARQIRGSTDADLDRAAHHDEAGLRRLTGGEHAVAARQLQERGPAQHFGDLAVVEAFEGRQQGQERPTVERSLVQALDARKGIRVIQSAGRNPVLGRRHLEHPGIERAQLVRQHVGAARAFAVPHQARPFRV